MAEAKVGVIIEAEDRASGVLAGVNSRLGTLNDKVKSMQPAFRTMALAGTVAFGAISALAVSSFKAFADAEAQTAVSTKSLENTIVSLTEKQKLQYAETGNVADVLKEVKEAMNAAGKAALKLGFDDEEAASSFAKLFAATKDSIQANKELQIAMDLSRYKNISLEDATKKLMLVHAGATKELKTLGLAVVEGATEMENMDAIMKQVSGTSQTFAATSAGAMQIMKVNADNLRESIGGALQPAFNKLKETLIPLVQKFVDWAEKHPDLIAKIIMIGGAVAGFVAVVGTLGMILPSIITGFTFLLSPIGLVIAAITALAALVYIIIANWEAIRVFFQQLWDGFVLLITTKVNKIKADITAFLTGIQTAWKAVWGGIRDFFVDIWNSITGAAKAAIDKIKSFLQPIIDMIQNVINKLAQIGGSIGKGFKKTIHGIGDFLGISDGIVQNGQVITTHPDDYIIATKTPETLGGGGKNININISGAIFTKEAAQFMGDMIIGQLKLNMKY